MADEENDSNSTQRGVLKRLISSVAAVLAVTAIASCSSDSTAESVPTTGAETTTTTTSTTTTTVPETTTTTTSTTVAPTTTIDPVEADKTAYFLLSSEYNAGLKGVGNYIDTKADCELAAELNTDFIAGLEDHPWRSEVEDEVDTLIRLKVLGLAQYQRCMRDGPSVLVFNPETGEAATLLRYALGLSVDRE